jgi:hypothetical protein
VHGRSAPRRGRPGDSDYTGPGRAETPRKLDRSLALSGFRRSEPKPTPVPDLVGHPTPSRLSDARASAEASARSRTVATTGAAVTFPPIGAETPFGEGHGPRGLRPMTSRGLGSLSRSPGAEASGIRDSGHPSPLDSVSDPEGPARLRTHPGFHPSSNRKAISPPHDAQPRRRLPFRGLCRVFAERRRKEASNR